MGTLGKTDYTVDNLLTSTVDVVTDDVYVGDGSDIVRGMVLKNTAGVLSPCLTTQAPFTIALSNTTGGATALSYAVECSFLESEVDANTGTIAEFRDALRSLNIIGER